MAGQAARDGGIHIHILAKTWGTTRDAVVEKENKVGAGVVPEYGYIMNAIGQRPSIARVIGWDHRARGEVVSANRGGNTVFIRFYEFEAIGNRIISRAGTVVDNGGTLTSDTANGLSQYAAPARLIMRTAIRKVSRSRRNPNARIPLIWSIFKRPGKKC